MACPDGLVATNFCSPIHLTDPVCMGPPGESIAALEDLKRAVRFSSVLATLFGLNGAARPVSSMAFGEDTTNANRTLKGNAPVGDRRVGTGGISLVIHHRGRSSAGRNGRRRKGPALRD